jgi:uncharacterized membrane protein YdjX (TVP38/TMEM64 family)
MGMTTRPPETCLRAAAMEQMRTVNWYVFVVVVLLLFVTFFSCCQLTPHSLRVPDVQRRSFVYVVMLFYLAREKGIVVFPGFLKAG